LQHQQGKQIAHCCGVTTLKYEQPWGVSDPNAAYINGNPSTGTMGSIPPAASIENPQREIVNFITDCSIVPTDADLHQLAKSVQSGVVNYAADTGPQNLIFVSLTPAVAALHVGLRIIVKMANANSGPVQVSVNGLAAVSLVHRDLTALGAFELVAGSMIDIVYDGTHFQLLTGSNASAGGGGGIITMTAPRTFYVNDATGDDTLYDGTSATVTTGGVGPFKTIRKALNTMTKYNLAGFNFTIQVADGTYNDGNILDFPVPNGSGQVYLTGNSANPNACVYTNTGLGTAFKVMFGGFFIIDGFNIGVTAPLTGDPAYNIWIGGNSSAYIGNMTFRGSGQGASHFHVGPGGSAMMTGNYNIMGGSGSFIAASANGIAFTNSPAEPNINYGLPNCNFAAGFANASNGGQIRALFASFGGNTPTAGVKFVVSGNGVIDTGGRGVNYLPGPSAGIIATGGQYL
jgi:hypothetical protein